MQVLKNLIQDELDRWHNTYPLELLFGTAIPEEVTQIINTFCQRELGSAIDGCYFYEVSQSIVAGLRLVDGQNIVINGQAYKARCEHSLHPYEQESKPVALKRYRDSFLLQ